MRSSNKNSSKHVIALHGFLGLAADWDQLEPLVPAGFTLHKEDLWTQLSDFKSWTEGFCRKMEKLEGTKILLGYSLGGRLALHALDRRPDLFSGAIIVSANPGLKTDAERAQRLQADQTWAEKFRKLPWPDLMAEWNGQAVFSNATGTGTSLAREEKDFDRELLAESLELWSLGFQRDLETALARVELPVMLVTGALDSKFTSIARALVEKSARGDRPLSVIAGAGHRVPWEKPAEFRSVVANFLSRWYR